MAIFFLIILLCSNHHIVGAVAQKRSLQNNRLSFTISKQEAQKIGQKILRNECGNDYQKLTWWNEGEEFASFGAIHAIWYPPGVKQSFKETFPALLKFIESKGKKIPEGIFDKNRSCPWRSRDEFMAAMSSQKMQKLRDFLLKTIDLQVAFAIRRLEQSLPQLLSSVKNTTQKNHIKQQFYRVAKSENGVYALVDYLNFKGEGSDPACSYHGHRWGLLQVLEGMKGKGVGKEALVEFVRSAKCVLTMRIKHAPPARNESRWLPGWFNRIDTYLK